jgi:hypothetical protein
MKGRRHAHADGQMRALAAGSDGLSSISTEDICSIVLPRIKTQSVRHQFEERIKEAKSGHLVLPQIVRDELALRSSHVVQV